MRTRTCWAKAQDSQQRVCGAVRKVPAPPWNELLSLLYYSLQDVVEEALYVFSIIECDAALKRQITAQVPLCFDYLRAYMPLTVELMARRNVQLTREMEAHT